jgi:predicted outer membrane protein
MMVSMMQQAHQTKLQMTREMLQEYDADEFDMAYIGQQIVAHTDSIAHLQAMRQANLPQLQQVISQSEQMAREHLDTAKQIAQELRGQTGRPGGQQARQQQRGENPNR